MLPIRWGKAAAAAAALMLAGCGYVGEPLPPLLNIPQPVADLHAMERGGSIVVEFTPPALTTEGAVLKRLGRLELRAGPGPQGGFNSDAWADAAKAWDVPIPEGKAKLQIPAAEWAGRQIILGVKAVGTNGRETGWSNLVTLDVVPPLSTPADVTAQNARGAVELTWSSPASWFRILRLDPGQQQPVEVAKTTKPVWLDSTVEFGKTYTYTVQAIQQAGNAVAESEISPPVAITPKDIFSPAVPTGIRAIRAPNSVELAWEPVADPDLAGYRVYRAEGNAKLTLVAETATPNYGDRSATAGTEYRYAVTALDKSGNESKMSAPVQVAGQ